MPIYELVCITSHNPHTNASLIQLIESISSKIISSGGLVRDVRSLGAGKVLPTRMRRHQQYYNVGDHFSLLFDTSPPRLAQLNEQLRTDPSVIRWTMLKKGSTIANLIPPTEFTMQTEIEVNSQAKPLSTKEKDAAQYRDPRNMYRGSR